MKKLLSLLGLSVFTVILLGGGCSSATTDNASGDTNVVREEENTKKNVSLYENIEYGIKIEYPNDWDKQENQYGSAVMLFAPQKGKDRSFTENLNIFVGETGGLYSPEEYVSLNMEQLRTGLANFNLLSEEDVDINGNTAHKISYTGLYEEIPLKWMQWFFLKGTNDYVITYSAQEEDYDAFVEAVEEMIETLEIN